MDRKPIELTADTVRNVLRIVFGGSVTGADLDGIESHASALVSTLRPGFILIVDLTDLEKMELDCVPHLTRLMDFLPQVGMRHVVRIIPDADKDIGFTLLSHTHYRGRVPFQTCQTRVEADAALEMLFRHA